MTHDDDIEEYRAPSFEVDPDAEHDADACEDCLDMCYVDGRNARRRGTFGDRETKLQDCPYEAGTRSWVKWRMGWTDVDAELNPPPAGSRSLAAVERDMIDEIDRVRLAINAARAAGFPLHRLEELHDEWCAARTQHGR